MSRSSAILNGKILSAHAHAPSAHASGLRISTNNPNVFFLETSPPITHSFPGNQARLYRNDATRHKNAGKSDRNAERDRNGDKYHKNGAQTNRNAKPKKNDAKNVEKHSSAFGNVTREFALANSHTVAMDAKHDPTTKGHIVTLPAVAGDVQEGLQAPFIPQQQQQEEAGMFTGGIPPMGNSPPLIEFIDFIEEERTL